MKAEWTYECAACEHQMVLEVDTAEAKRSFRGGCVSCRKVTTLDRVWTPEDAPAVAFGMLAKSVKGSGWHSVEYPSGKSDLRAGRAAERAAAFGTYDKTTGKRA